MMLVVNVARFSERIATRMNLAGMRFILEITYCTERYLLIKTETRTPRNYYFGDMSWPITALERSSRVSPRHKNFKSQSLIETDS
jgi:hypothetical protein